MDFDATFDDGYTFRHLIEWLKATHNDGIFVLSKDLIVYERDSKTNTVFNILEIRTCDIKYKFGKPANEQINLGVGMTDFVKNTKVGKKDGFRMFRETGVDQVSCQHICSDAKNTHNTDKSFLTPKRISYDETYYIDIPVPENSPNYSGSISEFSKVCSKITSHNPATITLAAYEEGIKLTAFDSTGRKLKENGFSVEEDTDKEPIQTISMSLALVKALSKIKNISPSTGIIKFYCVPDIPTIKFILSVGCYGKLTTFLRNPKDDDEEEDDEVET